MNKQALINQLALHASVNQIVAERVLDALTATVIDALRTRGELKLGELGRFTVLHRAARKALNPRTLKQIDVPAKSVARFKPGKALVAALK